MARILRLAGRFVVLACAVLPLAAANAASQPAVIPSPVFDNPKSTGPLQTAVLAGGCFWGVQGVYQHMAGVRGVLAGYSGGNRDTADYETVSGGRTGHAESVQITFDPQQVTFGEILQVFFSVVHDPTQRNGQGPDVGTQYRSAIFYADATQQKVATQYIAQLEKAGAFAAPIVTRVEPLKGFFTAEGYHQDFLLRNPNNLYIVFNDLPKIRAFQRTFPALYRSDAITVASSAH